MIPEFLTQIRARLCGYHAGPGSIIHKTALISRAVTMGRKCEIHPYVLMDDYKGFIKIGDYVSINAYCVLYGHGGLTIGNDVRIATGVVIVPANHVFDDRRRPIREQGLTRQGIVIEDDVWIGAGAKILDGVTIAKGCVIAAGAVVTKSTEPYGLYAGTPARKLKDRP